MADVEAREAAREQLKQLAILTGHTFEAHDEDVLTAFAQYQREAGAKKEREAVVEWLRKQGGESWGAALLIEKGRHRAE